MGTGGRHASPHGLLVPAVGPTDVARELSMACLCMASLLETPGHHESLHPG